jgi:hypothetical protein
MDACSETHPPGDGANAGPADKLPDERDGNVEERNQRPREREVRARLGVRSRRWPVALAHRLVVLVDRLGVEPERRQDERQAEVEQQRVDAPENMQRERDELESV